ncbi:hypothetical protein RvY_08479 [Ramazzottius varieornatus]|uniref:Uncharacterized protein n=1 Tax=Ramazzottius varieornatus TaxID=947166 RepID=A0A1D1V5Y0_RAMVA|nr:hypothetical protein RvY_08479 [Ramazzottius varieornatus]
MDKKSHLDENGLRVGDHIVAYCGPTEKSKPGYYSTIVRGVYDDKKTCDEALKALRDSKRKSAGPVIETERTKRLCGVAQSQTDEDLADVQKKLQSIVSSFYWKKQTPGSQQIRSGYDVWIKKTVLADLVQHYGPKAVCPNNGWPKYTWKLVLHMLGGEESVFATKPLKKKIGADVILKEPAILAVIGHVTEIFALTDPINKAFFKQKMKNNRASVESRFV